jgi:hypothetical protein
MQGDCVIGISFAKAGSNVAGACLFDPQEIYILYMAAATNVILLKKRAELQTSVFAAQKMANLLRPFLTPENELIASKMLSAMSHANNEGISFVESINDQVQQLKDKTINNL